MAFDVRASTMAYTDRLISRGLLQHPVTKFDEDPSLDSLSDLHRAIQKPSELCLIKGNSKQIRSVAARACASHELLHACARGDLRLQLGYPDAPLMTTPISTPTRVALLLSTSTTRML